jgi:hypothetical protein
MKLTPEAEGAASVTDSEGDNEATTPPQVPPPTVKMAGYLDKRGKRVNIFRIFKLKLPFYFRYFNLLVFVRILHHYTVYNLYLVNCVS